MRRIAITLLAALSTSAFGLDPVQTDGNKYKVILERWAEKGFARQNCRHWQMKASDPPSSAVPPSLQPVLQELQRLEPLFHAAHPEAGTHDFEQLVAPEFWEIGASGNRYSRAFALKVLTERVAQPNAASWQTDGFGVTELGADHFLLTYTLYQPGRVTRRTSIWRRSPSDWQVIYHQGTVVQGAPAT